MSIALETLKNVTEIDGFKVSRLHGRDGDDPMGDEAPVKIVNRENLIMFKIQDGPIKEVGVNGCQVDTLIETALLMLSGFNDKFPCEENTNALNCLEGALSCLDRRTRRRKRKGIEGYNKEET